MGFGLTNATKAIYAGLVSAALAMLTSFGLNLTGEQVGSINAFVDALLVVWIAVTYKDSPKRVEDEDVADLVKNSPGLEDELKEMANVTEAGYESDLPEPGNPRAGTPAG